MLGFLSAGGFLGFGEGFVALGQGLQLVFQVGDVLVGRIATVAHGLPVGAAFGIREENGRHALYTVLGAEQLVLLDLFRGLFGLVARAVEFEQNEILGNFRFEDILSQHVFRKLNAGWAPVGAGEFHQDAFALFGGLSFGFFEIN